MGSCASASLFYGVKLSEDDVDGLGDRLKKLPNRTDFDVEFSGDMCNGRFNRCFLSIKESRQGDSNYDDSPPIDISRLENRDDWYDKLQKACEMTGIAFDKPNWYIAASYG